ncbi:hypothetical protein [Aeoliella mucimassa]|uniref:Uncharacterized protein n=1 Tax=Aeoliella mucimassa TaxID=2527972 RepID=A0A518AV05_9BACT|nr:hypothetical protein [Aeoliella mucimassa]QDU58542.1 hypothetical protein Pan181_47800 [Aeoliella mucimassa]
METNKRGGQFKGRAILRGLDSNEVVVIEEDMSVVEYYDSLHPLLDDNGTCRISLGVRFVCGEIYDYDGKLDQKFRNSYDENGGYLKSSIQFADGTSFEG